MHHNTMYKMTVRKSLRLQNEQQDTRRGLNEMMGEGKKEILSAFWTEGRFVSFIEQTRINSLRYSAGTLASICKSMTSTVESLPC